MLVYAADVAVVSVVMAEGVAVVSECVVVMAEGVAVVVLVVAAQPDLVSSVGRAERVEDH